jgi:hypothetical protein
VEVNLSKKVEPSKSLPQKNKKLLYTKALNKYFIHLKNPKMPKFHNSRLNNKNQDILFEDECEFKTYGHSHFDENKSFNMFLGKKERDEKYVSVQMKSFGKHKTEFYLLGLFTALLNDHFL